MEATTYVQQVLGLNQQFINSNKSSRWEFIDQALAILDRGKKDLRMLIKPIFIYHFYDSEGNLLSALTDDEKVAQQDGEEYDIVNLEQLNENLGDENTIIYRGTLLTSDGLCEYTEEVAYFDGYMKVTECGYELI